MSKPKRENDDDFDEVSLFYHDELDVDEFLTNMGERTPRRPKRSAWQRLEDRDDMLRLRKQLEDWEDWDVGDSH